MECLSPRVSSHINCSSIQTRADVRSIIFFDHFDTGTAVFGYLIDIGALHQPQANVCVSEAVCRPSIAVTIELKAKLIEQAIKLPLVIDREDRIGRKR